MKEINEIIILILILITMAVIPVVVIVCLIISIANKRTKRKKTEHIILNQHKKSADTGKTAHHQTGIDFLFEKYV